MADRIEREIEEILKKIDDFVPEKPRSIRKRPADKPTSAFQSTTRPTAAPRSGAGGSLARVSLNQVMGWSLIAVLVAFFLPIPGSGWIILAALLVFGVAFLLSRVGGGGGSSRGVEKRWRGEPLDLSGPSLPERIRDWVKGKRRR